MGLASPVASISGGESTMHKIATAVLAALRWEPGMEKAVSGEHRDNEAQPRGLVIQWENLYRIRFWVFTCLFAGLASVVLGEWAIWPGIIVAAGVQLCFGRALGCTQCGKALKTRAVRCHHCGFEPDYSGRP